MIYAYKDGNFLGCSETEQELIRALQMAGASIEGIEFSDEAPPSPFTPHEPTKKEKLAQLVAQYESDKAEILKYYSDAMIHGDSDLMAELKEEMTALDEQYAADYKALKGEE